MEPRKKYRKDAVILCEHSLIACRLYDTSFKQVGIIGALFVVLTLKINFLRFQNFFRPFYQLFQLVGFTTKSIAFDNPKQIHLRKFILVSVGKGRHRRPAAAIRYDQALLLQQTECFSDGRIANAKLLCQFIDIDPGTGRIFLIENFFP